MKSLLVTLLFTILSLACDSAVVEQAVSDTTRRDVARFRVHVTFPE